MQIERHDLGYRTDGSIVLTVGRWGPPTFPPRIRRTAEAAEAEAASVRTFNRSILARLAGVTGLDAFALTTRVPLHGSTGEPARVIEQQAHAAGQLPHASATRLGVSDGYFNTLGVRLLHGRTFDSRDALYGKRAAVINESLARQIAPAGHVVGRSLSFVSADPSQKLDWLEIVGVVNDVKPVIDEGAVQGQVYVSLLQEWRGEARYLTARGHGDQVALVRGLKEAVIGSDTFAEVTAVQTMAQIAAEILYPRRVAAGVLAAAGLIGLALACIGLYGIVSYAAAQRQRELGIRATLGAAPDRLIALVLREGAGVVAVGILLGVGLALITLRLTAHVLPSLPTFDPVAFALMPVALVVVVVTACAIPARRAARIDPARVLRGE
jgi:putative ABC transport system permease protein